MEMDTIENALKEKDQKLEDLEKEKSKQLRLQEQKVVKLEDNDKAKNEFSKELKRLKKKITKAKDIAKVAIVDRNKTTNAADEVWEKKQFMEKQMQHQ